MFKQVKILRCNFLEENFIDSANYGPFAVWPVLKQVVIYGSGIDRVIRKSGLVKVEVIGDYSKEDSRPALELVFQGNERITVEPFSEEHFLLLRRHLKAIIVPTVSKDEGDDPNATMLTPFKKRDLFTMYTPGRGSGSISAEDFA